MGALRTKPSKGLGFRVLLAASVPNRKEEEFSQEALNAESGKPGKLQSLEHRTLQAVITLKATRSPTA